jgi:hypothetical protein
MIVQRIQNKLFHCYGHTERIRKHMARTANSLDPNWEVMQLEEENIAATRNL